MGFLDKVVNFLIPPPHLGKWYNILVCDCGHVNDRVLAAWEPCPKCGRGSFDHPAHRQSRQRSYLARRKSVIAPLEIYDAGSTKRGKLVGGVFFADKASREVVYDADIFTKSNMYILPPAQQGKPQA